jgi:transposase InsO family protein
MNENKVSEETALNRFKIISPILTSAEEGTDEAKLLQLKKSICIQHGISDRTLRRWLNRYKQNGFCGLKPTNRKTSGPNAIPEALIEEAILLRREVPSRSVAQIIEILEMEGKAPVGFIKRTTLQDRLMERGYSSRQMKLYQQSGTASRRFVRLNRNDMWHSDIKYGPYIVDKGEKKQIYLVSFMDDATRYVVHAEFYTSLDQTIVEDCFRKAVIKEGLPQRVYFDNGKQYRTKWMERACAKLEIKLLFARPYSPESTGKIERFNRTADSFLAEAKLKKLTTLDGYNHYFKVWLSECYHSKKHTSLMDTPENVYKASKAPLRFLPPDIIASAFLHCETRKVDKSGCISFNAKKYEVGIPFIGQSINVVFDPADTETLTIEHCPTGSSFQVKELKIGPYSGKRSKLPDTLQPKLSQTSRLLDAKEQQYKQNQNEIHRAISYTGFEDGEADV